MIHSAKTLFREMFGELSAWGRFWLYLGLLTLVWAAAMSYSFGAEISFKHAMFLMCLSAVAAFLPEAAYSQWEDGRKIVACVLGVIALPVLVIEFYTHAGYTAGLRGSNIETAMVQNSRYDGAQDQAKENAALLASFKKQLAEFRAKNEWTTTASADGLKKQLDVMQKEIDLEAARKGCKAKCAALMKKKADVETQIATIEEGNTLAAKIEGMQAVVDKKRDVAAHTEHKSSAVDHQNKFLAKTVALVADGSLKPTEIMSEGAQQTVNLMMALAGTGLPALALFVAGLYRRKDGQDHGRLPAVNSIAALLPSAPVKPAAAGPQGMLVHHKYDRSVHDALARLSESVGAVTAPYRTA